MSTSADVLPRLVRPPAPQARNIHKWLKLLATQPAAPNSRRLRIAMIGRMNAAADFVISAKKQLGDAPSVAKLQDEQAKQIILNASTMRIDVNEAAACMSILASAQFAEAFSATQLTGMAMALAEVQTEQAPTAAGKVKPASQVHYFFHVYLTDSDWDDMRGRSDRNRKVLVLVNRAQRIGLMYPTELTIAAMIALIKAVDPTLSTEESMNLVLEYKRVNKKTRTTVTKTFDTFPADVSDFLLAYPGRYPEGEAPGRCPIDIGTIERARASTAARKTHRSVAASSGSGGGSETMMQLSSLANAIMQMSGGVSPQGRPPVRRMPNITYFGPSSPTTPRAPLALTDGTFEQETPPPAEHHADSEPPDAAHLAAPGDAIAQSALDSAIAEVQQAIVNKKAAAAEAKKKKDKKAQSQAKKRPAAATSSEDEGGAPRKKPAAAPESPKAAVAMCKKNTKIGGKKPAKLGSAKPAVKPANAKNPTVQDIKTRSCMTARTGLPGEGMNKIFSYKNSGGPAAARLAATAWLKAKCTALGIPCEL